MSGNHDVVGLVPAAGKARRLGLLPISKEVLPIGFTQDSQTGDLRAEVASRHLFDKFRRAGIGSAFVIVRDGKWDIPAYFGEGCHVGVRLAYLVVADTIGPPDTLDRAYSFVADKTIAFGFPDILFGPDDVFCRLLSVLHKTKSDIVLGLYPPHAISEVDMIDVDQAGRVKALLLKPASSDWHYTWICAVWTAAFSRFMHSFLRRERAKTPAETSSYSRIDPQGDLPVGAVIKAAIESGVHVYGLPFPENRYLDLGSPKNVMHVLRGSTSI
jgi:dTDP-glucose pyrophosphorylase